MTRMFALLDHGTAASETALCEGCRNPDTEVAARNDFWGDEEGRVGDFVDCGDPTTPEGNDALCCTVCGWPEEEE